MTYLWTKGDWKNFIFHLRCIIFKAFVLNKTLWILFFVCVAQFTFPPTTSTVWADVNWLADFIQKAVNLTGFLAWHIQSLDHMSSQSPPLNNRWKFFDHATLCKTNYGFNIQFIQQHLQLNFSIRRIHLIHGNILFSTSVYFQTPSCWFGKIIAVSSSFSLIIFKKQNFSKDLICKNPNFIVGYHNKTSKFIFNFISYIVNYTVFYPWISCNPYFTFSLVQDRFLHFLMDAVRWIDQLQVLFS